MTEQELNRLLSVKTPCAPRENVACVLAPDIYRNAMRLKKRRRNRVQTLACAFAGALFVALSVVFFRLLQSAEQPQTLLRGALFVGLGCMALTLLLSPALAWYSEKDAG